MKITCSQSSLLKSLNISLRAVPSRTTMPILECVLIDAKGTIIRFITNDMELGIETIVEGSIVEKGEIALDAKIFYEIIRKMPNGNITISSDENLMTTIVCGKTKFQIPGRNPEDFVFLPIIERGSSLTLTQFTLKEMVRQTIFSIAANENNKLMTGELFEIKGNVLRIVSLDGHRISIRTIPLAMDYPDIKVVVPGKTLGEISKILSGEAEDRVVIYFSENHVLFELENTIILSRLIEGDYFQIDQMLSVDHDTVIQINTKQFLEAIDRSTLFLKEGDKKPLIIRVMDDALELFIESAIGSMDESIDIKKDGKDIVIGFNPRYLSDALRVIDQEEVTLYFLNPKAPCFIRDEEGTYTYLILPVNINQSQYV